MRWLVAHTMIKKKMCLVLRPMLLTKRKFSKRRKYALSTCTLTVSNVAIIGPVSLKDFNILRSVGRGSFGKVCIVEKKDTKHLYGLKYMHKKTIVEKEASRNVLKEIDILKRLHCPFIVNLNFTFQDDEDMYLVLDLMLGGDVRFHMNEGHKFTEDEIKLYILEIGTALDYLRVHNIVHRDLKPDNLLLDSKGHIHITDFNIATLVPDGKVALSLTGTKPYIAPEVFATSLGRCSGYSFPVDWWSLGVTICEMVRGKRPFDIHHDTAPEEIMKIFSSDVVINLPHSLSSSMFRLITNLLQPNASKRISCVDTLMTYAVMQSFSLDKVTSKLVESAFIPRNDSLNCDPTYELEEMMIESKPLHKKKYRNPKKPRKPSKEGSDTSVAELDPIQREIEILSQNFTMFRRDRSEELVSQLKLECSSSSLDKCANPEATSSVTDSTLMWSASTPCAASTLEDSANHPF